MMKAITLTSTKTELPHEAASRRLEEILAELQSLSRQWDEALFTQSGKCREISNRYIALQREACLLRDNLPD